MHNTKASPPANQCFVSQFYDTPCIVWHMWSNCFVYPVSVQDMIVILSLFVRLTSFFLNRVIPIRFTLDQFYNKCFLGRFILCFIVLWLFTAFNSDAEYESC